MIIVRLLSTRAFMVGFGTTKFTRALGAGIVMESITVIDRVLSVIDFKNGEGSARRMS
jgi:hypothetical protein